MAKKDEGHTETQEGQGAGPLVTALASPGPAGRTEIQPRIEARPAGVRGGRPGPGEAR